MKVTTRQEVEIQTARALLKPSPVRHHHVPRWFKRAFKKASQYGHPPWLDHYGSSGSGEKQVFIAEPYHVNAMELAACEALARTFGLHCYVDSNSWWYPGMTIRLTFKRGLQ